MMDRGRRLAIDALAFLWRLEHCVMGFRVLGKCRTASRSIVA
jgi:hypothetical protein